MADRCPEGDDPLRQFAWPRVDSLTRCMLFHHTVRIICTFRGFGCDGELTTIGQKYADILAPRSGL